MRKLITIIACSILAMPAANVSAQANRDEVLNKLKQAIKLEDDGNMDDAIAMLQDAEKLYPDSYACPYELAYAYSLKKDYKKSIDIAEKAMKYKDADDQAYQLVGNCYDEMGKSDKALKVYADGIKKFPNSGRLYLETGVVLMGQKDYNKALAAFENGLQVDPAFPSNYYWAAKIFLGTDEKVWGMIYGELFMNLERNSKRTGEISKLLFDTYKSQIKFTSDTSSTVSFSKNNVISISDLKDLTKLKLPFGGLVYEPCMALATATQKSININTLDTVRQSFLDLYFKKFIKSYPIVLFYYQNEIEVSGNFEAYNHWLLMKGDEDAFNQWQAANKDKWDTFTKWYNNNPIQVYDKNKFYRAQYQ